MAIEVMLVKGQDGSLRPASAADQEHMGKFKTGQAVRVTVTQIKARSLQHHRLFFGGLIALAMDYYEPPGGLITPAERQTLVRFAAWLDRQGGNTGSIRRAQEAYLADLEQRRAKRIDAPHKSQDALLEWLKLEVGHFDLLMTPRGVVRRTRSINFNAMSQDEFADFYRRCFSVIWRFILSQVFSTEDEAQQAVDLLLQYGKGFSVRLG